MLTAGERVPRAVAAPAGGAAAPSSPQQVRVLPTWPCSTAGPARWTFASRSSRTEPRIARTTPRPTAGDASGSARWPTTSGQRTQQRREPPGEHGSVGGYAGAVNHGTLPVSIVACPVRDDVLQYGVPLAGVCALTAGQPFHLPDAAVPYPRRCNGLRMTQQEYRFPLGCPLIGELAQLCQSFVIRTQVTFAFLPAKLSCPHALDVDVLDRVAVVGVGLSALLIPPRGLCPPPPVRSAAAPAR